MSRVKDHYDKNALDEWNRLDRHRTEFAVTLQVLADYLPSPPAAILDVGGGPGRYTIELSKAGYTVTLLDLSEACLRLAREKAADSGIDIYSLINGDARDLNAIEASSHDAVLLMGPLYHLPDSADRLLAVKEALRVLKPGGLIFAAFITRFAPFRSAASRDPAWYVENKAYAQQILQTGVHLEGERFPNAYFALPNEITPWMEDAGFKTRQLVGCEGIVSLLEDKINKLTGRAWRDWLELNYRLGQEPLLHGAAEHLLYVGEKNIEDMPKAF